MYPVLFKIGTIEIQSYTFFLILGILIGLWVAILEARRYNSTIFQIFIVGICVIPFAYIMAIVNGWIFAFRYDIFLETGQILYPGGLISFGVILGALFMGKICAKFLKLPVEQVLDPIVLALAIILGVLRIGCLLNGCCYGMETNSFLGMVLPGDYGIWANRYPTQIMLCILNLGLFAWLWFHRTKKPFDTYLVLHYLIIYSIGRLIIDSFRDLPYIWGQISPYHLFSLIILIVAWYFYFKKKKLVTGLQIS